MASSSSSPATWNYDVFLSFRGEDTRYTFTDHLYKALCEKGIVTFKDDQLRRGEMITPALLTAIERSRHAIIVFSENYASSKWCLDELVKILLTQNTQQRRAVPIFYHVNPSDVRKQRGSLGKALVDHETELKADHEQWLKYGMKRVKEWREALTQVGTTIGLASSPDK